MNSGLGDVSSEVRLCFCSGYTSRNLRAPSCGAVQSPFAESTSMALTTCEHTGAIERGHAYTQRGQRSTSHMHCIELQYGGAARAIMCNRKEWTAWHSAFAVSQRATSHGARAQAVTGIIGNRIPGGEHKYHGGPPRVVQRWRSNMRNRLWPEYDGGAVDSRTNTCLSRMPHPENASTHEQVLAQQCCWGHGANVDDRLHHDIRHDCRWHCCCPRGCWKRWRSSAGLRAA